MTAQAFAALAAVVIHLFSSVAGGLLYLCKMDGQVRSACCCHHERQADERSAIARECCCEVSVVAAAAEPTLADKRLVDPAQGPLSLLPGLLPPSTRHGTAVPVLVDVGPSPPGGPPLFLKLRTLLI